MVCSWVSAITLLIAGMFIMFNKKFNKHPYPLIATACLLNSMYFSARFSNVMMCKYQTFNYLKSSMDFLSDITGGLLPKVSLIKLYTVMQLTYKVMTLESSYLTITVNSFIFLDLWLTIKNPFQPR